MGFSRQECWSGVPLPSASQEHWQPSNSMSNNRLQGFEIEHKGFLLRFEEACHSRINLAECHLSPSVCMACFQGEQVPVQCSCACFRSAGTDGAFTRQLQKELAGGIGTRGFYPTAAEGAGWRDRNQTHGAFTRQLQKELAGGIGTRWQHWFPHACALLPASLGTVLVS